MTKHIESRIENLERARRAPNPNSPYVLGPGEPMSAEAWLAEAKRQMEVHDRTGEYPEWGGTPLVKIRFRRHP